MEQTVTRSAAIEVDVRRALMLGAVGGSVAVLVSAMSISLVTL